MKKKKGKRKTIFEMYEPAELEMRHFTEQDNEIRNTDIPERMQLRGFPVRFVISSSFIGSGKLSSDVLNHCFDLVFISAL